MATAQKNASAQVSAGQNGTPIRVITPDQDGHFHLKIAQSEVVKVQIVDVDMVLNLADGTRMVLAGGALGAMDDSVNVYFNKGQDSAAHLLEQVGKVDLHRIDQPLVLRSDPANVGPEEHRAFSDRDAEHAAQAQSANATLATIGQALVQLASVVQDNAQPLQDLVSNPSSEGAGEKALVRHVADILPERPGKTPQEYVIGPNEPAMTVSLANTTSLTKVGDVLYGSGGSIDTPNSATNYSNTAQIAPQVIHAGNDVRTIYASGSADGKFVKVLAIDISGDGNVQKLVVSGVPNDMKILNGTSLGGGKYEISVQPNQKQYALQLQYDTVPADSGSPIHEGFKLTFELSVVTTDGVQIVTSVKSVVVKDATSATDLSYADPVTGESVFVLPAQGIVHEVHAGDGGVTIYGSNANDLLYGGAGDDTILGGTGNTYFEGGAGDDTLTGGNGGNNTVGYKGAATGVTVDLNTGTAQDGAGGTDTLSHIQNAIGSSHDDRFVVGADTKHIDGGAGGSDTVDFSASTAGVNVDMNTGKGTGGYAQNTTFAHIQNAVGSSFDDTFVASSVANAFDGGAGSNTVSYASSPSSGSANGVAVDLLAGSGSGGYAQGDQYTNIQNVIGTNYDDTFVGNATANHFEGGTGNDTVSYAGSASGVTVDLYKGQGTDGNAAGDTYRNIENVIGSAHDDTFVVDTDSRHFDGGSGGDDTLSYERSLAGVTIDAEGNKGGVITGADGSGHPIYSNSYAGIDKFIGSTYQDTFLASSHADNFDGIAGADTISYAADSAGVVVNLSISDIMVNGVTVEGGHGKGGMAEGDQLANIENITGGSGSDVFIASDAANVFDGAGGSNTVNYSASTTGGVTVDLFHTDGTGTSGGFAQGDRFINIQNATGTVFNDTFIANAAANRFDGDGGENTVSYAYDSVGVTVNLATGNGSGIGSMAAGDHYDNIQNAIGGSGNDTFVSAQGANTFDGRGGVNTISYAMSDVGVTVDLVDGTGSGGYAQGDALTNIQNVIGSTHNDLFIASSAANTFSGNGGVDTVSYLKATDGNGVIVDLDAGTGSGGYAQGDRYDGIRNVVGTNYDDTFVANNEQNLFDGALGSNTVSYTASNAGVTVDLLAGTGTGGYAQGDQYTAIQNAIGGAGNDIFIASGDENALDGGGGGHNTVSYAGDSADLTIDLLAGAGSGGNAQGDTYAHIQDATGGSGNDTFIASAEANALDGGGGTHNRVSYVSDTADLTIDLLAGTGSGGNAQGDTYAHIQDATGGTGNDTFIANGQENAFDGGGGMHNRVSYAGDNADLIIDLAAGTGSGGSAQDDTYTHVQDATGGGGNDTFVAGSDANAFDGGGGINTVSYAASVAGVIVNLSDEEVDNVASNTGSGNDADGDGYTNIQNVIGSSASDVFIAGLAANSFKGNGGSDTVSYASSTTGVTVNLSAGTREGAAGNSGANGDAQGDSYDGISNVDGSQFDDVFVANGSANAFDGGGGTHNRISYAASAAGVIVNLSDEDVGGVQAGTGSGGDATGDQYQNIQDVTGSSGNDLFIASGAANKFEGNGGNDTVSYAASDDAVIVNLGSAAQGALAGNSGSGGYATDDVYVNIRNAVGGAGNDLFYGGVEANAFDGGGGSHNRVSYVGDSADLFIDLAGSTGAYGNAEGDTYTNIQDATGGNGNDTFVASSAANNFVGGTGSDTVSYASSNVGIVVNMTGQTLGSVASLQGDGGYATGDSYSGIENVTGSNANDVFYASEDTTAAANHFYGGGGTHNLVSYQTATDAVIVDLSTATGTGSGGAAGDTYVNIQDVTGGAGDDTFIASSSANTFDGAGGTHNRVSYAGTSGAVNVNLATGEGSGAAQNDHYINVQDVTGGTGSDTFVASAAANRFDGGNSSSDSDTVDYSASDVGVTVNFTAQARGGAGALEGNGGYATGDTYNRIENVIGSSADDIFYAVAANGINNTFYGGSSTATSHNRVSYESATTAVTVNLFAGSGAAGAAGDTYGNIQDAAGGTGNDTFIAAAVTNRFDGGTGSNTVSYASLTGPVNVDISGQTGASAFQNIFFNIQNLIGTSGNDTLGGAAGGNSTLTGGAGADVLTGYGANNTASYGGAVGIAVNLSSVAVGGLAARTGKGGDAEGDTYNGIQNVTGGTGSDLFIASSDVNVFNGGTGAGINTVSYAGASAGVVANLNRTTTGNALASSGDAAGDAYTNIQNLTGSAYADTLTGRSAGGSVLTGGAGADQLIGSGYNGGTAATTSNTANYADSAQGVTINLSAITVETTLAAGDGRGGDAQGDHLTGIQNLVGSSFDDVFYASSEINNFNGGISDASSHNRVAYTNATGDMIINLSNAAVNGVNAERGSGGHANGDIYTNIQDVTGGGGNDTFISGAAANHFDGGGGNNTVSYAGNATAVSVDLFHNTGSGGYAQGDTYTNIRNVIGTTGSDMFYAGNLSGSFNGGGVDGNHGTDTVSYQHATSNLEASLANSATNTGFASGNSYTRIDNLVGSEVTGVISILHGNDAANTLTALGSATINTLDGGVGNDLLDGRLGGYNTLIGGAGDDTFWVKVGADGSSIDNIDHITGGNGEDTLRIDNLGTTLNMAQFLGGVNPPGGYKATGITEVDANDGKNTTFVITAEDVMHMGVNDQLNLNLNNGDTLQISGNFVAGNGYYSFRDVSNNEIARINYQYA